jgi:hypothetical protein
MKFGYIEVSDRIEGMIHSKELKAGDRLPSNLELAEKFGVTPLTVQRGLSRLKSKGLLSRSPRRGTYVNGRGVGSVIGIMLGESPLSIPSPFYRLVLNKIYENSPARNLSAKAYYPIPRGSFEQFREASEDIAAGLLRCMVFFVCNGAFYEDWKNKLQIPWTIVNFELADKTMAAGAGHLLDSGRRKILALSMYATNDVKRAEGLAFGKAFSDRGLSPEGSRLVVCGQDLMDGYAAVRELLRAGEKFDAIHINHDIIVPGVMMALLEAGLKTPSDVAVSCHANKGVKIASPVPLTTAEVDLDSVAEAIIDAASSLCAMPAKRYDFPKTDADVILKKGLST